MGLFKRKKFGNIREISFFGLTFKYCKKTKYKVVNLSDSGITKEKRNPKIIVSLTSFPARINFVHITIASLLNQTVKPDEVILWLAEEEFERKELDLPENLLKMREYGLTIMWCKNLRSYKKLIPALIEFPDDNIVTVDDDAYYDRKMLEHLYKAYLEQPQYIHCHRCTKMYYENSKIKALIGGKKYYKKPCFANKLVGLGGVFYPAHSLYKDVINVDLFLNLAPTNDDIWFWLMAVLNDVKINVVKNNISKPLSVNEMAGSPTLTEINDHGEMLFYKDLYKILSHYDGLEDKIKLDL